MTWDERFEEFLTRIPWLKYTIYMLGKVKIKIERQTKIRAKGSCEKSKELSFVLIWKETKRFLNDEQGTCHKFSYIVSKVIQQSIFLVYC